MEVVKNELIKKEFEIYKKSWDLIKEYYYVQDVKEDAEQERLWSEIHDKAKLIYYIQGDDAVSRLAQNITLSVLDYLADKCKLKERGVLNESN